jgi:hypothetical protein
MTDFFCDHGAYGLASNRLGLDAPTWGVPQEGDGTTKDAATASGVAVFDFTAGQPLNNETVAICGVTFTAKTSGATGNQFNIGGSKSATMDNLAAAINASTTTVGATVAAGTPQLRNLVYARGPTGGAPSDKCEIMMRIGSLTLNHATNSNVAIAHACATAPTLTQFVGGSGGCWGWFLNPSALGVSSSITTATYGAMLYKPYVCAAVPTFADTIYVRTGGGASKTIAMTFTSSTTLTHAASYSKNIVFDTNTKWTGDSTSGAVKLQITASNWNTDHGIRFSAPGIRASYSALAFGGFEVEYISSQTQGTFRVGDTSGSSGTSEWHMRNVILRDSMTGAGAGFGMNSIMSGSGSIALRTWENCKWIVTTARSSVWSKILSIGGYSTSSDQKYIGCIFDFNISGVSDPGYIVESTQTSDTSVLFQGCQFLGFASGYKLMSAGSWATNTYRLAVTVDNCSGLALPSSYIGFPTSTVLVRQDLHRMTLSNAALSTQAGLRVEDCRGVAEWLPDDPTPFPYLAATLPGSNTAYSVRLIWVRAVPLGRSYAYLSPDMRMFTQLASATRTLTLQLFMPSTVTSGVKASFTYIDSSGITRCEDTETIASSSASWTNAGSYSGFVARKFEVTTDYAIKANSEIIATVQLYELPPGSDATVAIYVDPEFTVT